MQFNKHKDWKINNEKETDLKFRMLKIRLFLLFMLHRVSSLPHTPIPRTGYNVLFSYVDVFHLL